MNILSYIDGHTATAALICDHNVKACVSEERFSRKKCQTGYPRKAIEYCLSFLGNRELDFVIVNGKCPPDPMYIRLSRSTTYEVKDFVDLQYKYFYPVLFEGKPQAEIYEKYYKDKLKEKNYPDTQYDGMETAAWTFNPKSDAHLFRKIQMDTIVNHLKINPERIVFIEHHPAHAAYAYFASPFRRKETLVFTLDGSGENINATISIAQNDVLQEVFRASDANIGRLWKCITLVLAMKPDQHEYKVMGLAPYASKKHSLNVMRIFEENFLYVDGIEFKYHKKPKDMYFFFKQLLEGERFDAIAGGLQLYTEKIVSQWIENAIEKFCISRVVFSGGLSMNIKLNKSIASLPKIKEFYVSPSGGDESLAMGVFYKHLGYSDTPPLTHMYMGPEYDSKQIRDALHPFKNKYVIKENVSTEHVARYLAEGFVIARFDGRMEFGARALGNRSILANPSNGAIVKKINTQIKNRDFWMPFTPTVLEYRQNDYILNPKYISCPYMTMAFDTTQLAQKELIGALHPYDYTIRPQILSEVQNSKYYQLIHAFEKITGIGGILNTSFNLHGEPVVCSPQDAMYTFENSSLDMLYIGDVLVQRKSNVQ